MSNTREKHRIIAIVGPTASGKTTLAISIARRFNGEIVSADSRQIYRGMDVGTAKPRIMADGRWQMANGIRHHLINIKNPNENYTLAEYKSDAVAAIKKILHRGKLPILVGGTGLYIRAVVENLDIPKVKPNPALREEIEKRIQRRGLQTVFEELVRLDPEAAYIVDRKNSRRVVCALEVTMLAKMPFSAQRKKSNPLFDTLEIGVVLPRDELRKRILSRVDEMTNDGLFREVRILIKKYGDKCIAFDAIGYREVIDCLSGTISRAEAIERITKNTWDYAKRQMTWFRKDKEIQWVKNGKDAENLIRNFLAHIP